MDSSEFFNIFGWAWYLWNYNFVIYGYNFSFFSLFLFGIVAWGVMRVIWSAVDSHGKG